MTKGLAIEPLCMEGSNPTEPAVIAMLALKFYSNTANKNIEK
jgi:hypothetical protein